jgi:hypothetical protein
MLLVSRILIDFGFNEYSLLFLKKLSLHTALHLSQLIIYVYVLEIGL